MGREPQRRLTDDGVLPENSPGVVSEQVVEPGTKQNDSDMDWLSMTTADPAFFLKDSNLVQAVVLAEAALERDELLARSPLEADKEQAGVELACLGVHAVGEGVASAQYLFARVCAGEAYVGVHRGQGQAVGTHGLEVNRVELVLFA